LAPQLKKAIENLYAMSQRALAKGQNNYIYALCTYCGKEILTPELKVMIGKRLKTIKGSYHEENTVFFSAEELHRLVEMLFLEADDMKIDMRLLREFNKQIFWNMVYYFNEFQLPFEFFLPYEDNKSFDQ
jgi:hypothetical protein